MNNYEMLLAKKLGTQGGGGFTPTQAQLDAMNSGIDSTKVQQISTNETNIVSIQQEQIVQNQDIADLKRNTSKVYGFHINPNESDSSAAVTYLEDAVGMTPAAMGSTAFSYGSWENAFFMPKPCMVKADGTVDYYLDPNDYSKKADGTASDISNLLYNGNAMMEWGMIWFKYVAGTQDGEWSFYVSDTNVDGTYKCWCNINSNNDIVEHFYTPIYNGTTAPCYDATSTYSVDDLVSYPTTTSNGVVVPADNASLYKCTTAVETAEVFDISKWEKISNITPMRSISGRALSPANGAEQADRATEINRARANSITSNADWYTEVWADRLLINALLYLMGKSIDLQGTFGQGISSGNENAKRRYVTGTLNDKGLFYGDITGISTAVKVFGMENPWGCCWRGIAGCILVNGVLKVKLTYGTADGSTAVGYNTTGANYLSFGGVPTSNNWLSKITADPDKGYKPSAVQSNSSYYYKDYFYQNQSGTFYLLLGGSSVNGAGCGFYCDLHIGAGGRGWSASAALSLKPLS